MDSDEQHSGTPDRKMAILARQRRALPERLARFNELVKAAQKTAQREEREFCPFTFHHLRHYYAVMYLKNGGNIYTLQQHLNRKSITTTEIYLAFLTPEEAMRAKYGSTQNPAQLERFESER
jgi:integrase/recombinase XerD